MDRLPVLPERGNLHQSADLGTSYVILPSRIKAAHCYGKNAKSLAVQPRKLHYLPETFAGRKIEGNNFILRIVALAVVVGNT
jgi:hypothetical protein